MQNSIDNTRYEGEIRKFKKQGLGKVTFLQKQLDIEGMWKDGILTGEVDIRGEGVVFRKAVYENNKFVKYLEEKHNF